MLAHPGSCSGISGTTGAQRDWYRIEASPSGGGEAICPGTAWKNQQSPEASHEHQPWGLLGLNEQSRRVSMKSYILTASL